MSIRCFAVTVTLLASGLALAQTAPAAATASTSAQSAPADRSAVEPRIERIHIEDSRTVIDEVRVGGATKSIDVKPKGDMPAYQVAPESGERSWKVLGF